MTQLRSEQRALRVAACDACHFRVQRTQNERGVDSVDMHGGRSPNPSFPCLRQGTYQACLPGRWQGWCREPGFYPRLENMLEPDGGDVGRGKWHLLHTVPAVGEGRGPRSGKGAWEEQLTCSMGEERGRGVSNISQREFKGYSVVSGLLSAQASPMGICILPRANPGPPCSTPSRYHFVHKMNIYSKWT